MNGREILSYLNDLAQAVAIILLAFMLLGWVMGLGHSPTEYQRMHNEN
jgi:disulfide bond formation protein DsbB